MLKLGNILIFGDSYSAYEGYIPDGYHFWYDCEERIQNSKVFSIEDTWWGQLLKETDSKLLLNDSFSGSTVCNTERPTIPFTSFCYRLENLIEKGFFKQNAIDTVFIFGGTNDSWIGSPLGEMIFDDFTEDRKKEIFPAYAYLITTLKNLLPNAKILPMINCDINPLVMDGLAKVSEKLGVFALQLKDISKYNGHPDKTGMTQIKDQVINFLLK